MTFLVSGRVQSVLFVELAVAEDGERLFWLVDVGNSVGTVQIPVDCFQSCFYHYVWRQRLLDACVVYSVVVILLLQFLVYQEYHHDGYYFCFYC